MFSPDADLFFEPPTAHRPPPNRYGLLHLLRRDIIQCLGRDPTSGAKLVHRALWPAAMGILAGIDLLAKYLAGKDDPGGVGSRYRDYLNRYCQPLGPDDAETLYQFRNALIHSFGLYSESKRKSKIKCYHFGMSFLSRTLITHEGKDGYTIDLCVLHKRFKDSISLFQCDLQTDAKLQTNFKAMFPKYGATRYG
jgi:hypothetical protein